MKYEGVKTIAVEDGIERMVEVKDADRFIQELSILVTVLCRGRSRSLKRLNQ